LKEGGRERIAVVTSDRFVLFEPAVFQRNAGKTIHDIALTQIRNVQTRASRPFFGLAIPQVAIRLKCVDGHVIGLVSSRTEEANLFAELLNDRINTSPKRPEEPTK